MSPRRMRFLVPAVMAWAELTSRGAQSDRVALIQTARKDVLIYIEEDLKRVNSPGYLPGKIDELKGLIRGEILRQLNSGKWTDSTLLTSLSPALTEEWHGPLSLIHKQFNGSDYVIIGYSIRHGGSALPDSTVVIEAYRKAADGYELADQTGDGLANSLAKLEDLQVPWTNEAWFIGHGQQTGVMQYHERVRIYSFDGTRFKELWGHEPLRGAEL